MNDVSGLDVTTDVWTLYGILCHFNASLYYGQLENDIPVLDTSKLAKRHSAENLAVNLGLEKANFEIDGKSLREK